MALTKPRLGQIESNVSVLNDPITVLNGGADVPNVDIGLLFNRANGLVSNVSLYWNEASNSFITAFTSNSGGTDSNITVSSYANIHVGSLTVTGTILPTANVEYDIGSSTQRFRSLYLSGNTIDLSGATIKSTDELIIFTNPLGGSFSVTGTTPGQASGVFGNLIANSGSTSTSTTSGALQVIGGAGISGDVFVGGNLDVTGTVTFHNTVIETSTETVLGVEIVGGNLVANSGTESSSTTTGALVVAGGAGISGSLYIANTGEVSANIGAIYTHVNTLDANVGLYESTTNANIGAIYNHVNTLDANVGLYESTTNANIGAYETFANAAINSLYTNANANTAAYLTVYSGSIGGTLTTASQTNITSVGTLTGLTSSGIVNITNATTSTSTSTGAAVINGGIGVSGNIYVDKVYTVNGLYWAGNGYVLSSGGGGSAAGTTGQIQYNDSGVFAGASLNAYSNSSIVATGAITSTNTTSGSFQVLGGVGITGALYTGSAYDNGNRVLTSLSSSGTGNLTVSVSAPTGTTIALPTTGPGATTVGSASAIPVITTDAYGRIASVSTASVSSTLNLTGTTGTGLVNLTSANLTFAGTNGVTASVSGVTVTIASAQDLQTSATPAFAGATINGTLVATTINAGTIGNTSSNLVGTIGTASQTNITTLGNLTALDVIGTSKRGGKAMVTNFTGAAAPANPQQGDEWWYTSGNILYKYINDGTTSTWVNINSSLYNASTSATASTLALRDTNGNLTATNFIGVASSAKYADLAEIYVADQIYDSGTVVIFGGEEEITVTDKSHDPRVAGVISTNPAYLMNSECEGLPVAFTGRVPCLVQGPVKKGDLLVTSNKFGVAQAIDNTQFIPGCVIGKSLENITTKTITTIEVVVGRF